MQEAKGGVAGGATRRDADAAVNICRQMRDHVADVLVARVWEIDYAAFQASAAQLLAIMPQLGVGLSVEFEFFRDNLSCPDEDWDRPHTDAQIYSFTEFALPMEQHADGSCCLHYARARQWLTHMQHLESMIQDAADLLRPSRRGRNRGGRKKKPETLRLEREVQAFFREELVSLRKNGCEPSDRTARLQAIPAADVIRAINHRFDRSYPTGGDDWERVRKLVTRSPAWDVIHHGSPEYFNEDSSPDDVADRQPTRDHGWALENRLEIGSSQGRTK